jgi:hypothetical protein
MLKLHLAFEDIDHGLNDEPLAQHELVGQRIRLLRMLRQMRVIKCRLRCQSVLNSSRLI